MQSLLLCNVKKKGKFSRSCVLVTVSVNSVQHLARLAGGSPVSSQEGFWFFYTWENCQALGEPPRTSAIENLALQLNSEHVLQRRQCPEELHLSFKEGLLAQREVFNGEHPLNVSRKCCTPRRYFALLFSAWGAKDGVGLTSSRCLRMLLFDLCLLSVQLVFCLFQGFTVLNYWIFGYYMPEDVDWQLKSELVLDAV